jgi:ABC-type antimicrobial peptide transport system permease subunit
LNGFTLFFFFSLVTVIGLLAGIYPAFVLSRFRPIEVLKENLSWETTSAFSAKD